MHAHRHDPDLPTHRAVRRPARQHLAVRDARQRRGDRRRHAAASPLLARIVARRSGGQVVKTLGDGLMAVFDTRAGGVQAADDMHDVAGAPGRRAARPAHRPAACAASCRSALAHGEVVEMAGDCFGDAVNVAARLLDHAGDNETLVTVERARRPRRAASARAFAAWTGCSCAAGPSRCTCTCSRRRAASATPPPPPSATSSPRRRARGHPPDLARPEPRSIAAPACRWCSAAARRPPTSSTTPGCRARMRASTGTAAPSSSPT